MEVGMDSRGGSGKAEHEELGFKEAPARGLGVAAAVVVQEADERAQIHAGKPMYMALCRLPAPREAVHVPCCRRVRMACHGERVAPRRTCSRACA